MAQNRWFSLALLGGLLLFADLILVWSRQHPSPGEHAIPESPARPDQPVQRAAIQTHPTAGPLPSPSATVAARTISQALADALDQALAALLREEAPDARAAALQRLKRLLESAPPSAAITAIRTFLSTGRDANSGQGYAIGVGGRLEKAPSLRTFLLDELGAIAKGSGDSQAMQAVAREILATPGSADEWSIALRNLAWADKSSGAFLNSKFAELVNQQQWTQNPTAGFLEAFDVPVYTHDAGSIAILAPLLQSQTDQPTSVSRAAAIALDRLAEQSPLEVMNYLNSNPGILSDSAMLRADYFSKADLGNDSQRTALETYFARADVSDSEKAKAVEGLVSPGSFVSDSLLSSQPPPDDSANRQKLLAKAANDWAGRFPAVSARLKVLLELVHE